MWTNISTGYSPPLGSDFNHLFPVGGQRHRFPHPWVIEGGLADVHDKIIPPGAWSDGHHRVREVLFQDVSLGTFEMAADSRHGQLSRPKGGEDLGEISHDDGLVPVDVRQAWLPVVRVALGAKIDSRRM